MCDSLTSRFNNLPDLHQNPRFAQSMRDTNWEVLGKPGNYLFLKKLGPWGIAKIQHPNLVNLSWLKKMRKKHHILTTYVEPGLQQSDLKITGFKVSPFANSATSLIDLKLTETELLNSFKSKTRYNIKHTEKKDNLKIITKKFQDLTADDKYIFKNSYKLWSKRKKVICYGDKFFNSLFKNFGDSGWIHFAYYMDKCVASLMIIKNEKAAIYYAAFADLQGYSLFAPTILTWRALITAKKADCEIFDFGGIYDPRYKTYKKWKGFTRFKDGFSPTVVYYPPTKVMIGSLF